VIGSDGTVYPLIVPKELLAKAGIPENDELHSTLRRLEGSHLWLMLGNGFYKLDLVTQNMRKLADLDLDPETSRVYYTSTNEGLYYVSRDKLHLIDWNGKDRVISEARL
jgi:hypothetical protein